MQKPMRIELKSMEHNEPSRSWTINFLAKAPFVGSISFSVNVEDSDPDPQGEPVKRPPEDVLGRARRRAAIGLGAIAAVAMDGVDEGFKSAVTAEVLALTSAPNAPDAEHAG